MMQAQNNVLMLTGVSPSIGKTFVCANLAAVISQTHKRVLLIDCDMRRATPMNCSAPITWTAYLTFWRAKAR
ncbi:tyrosine kinase [Salmonella enterica subsp. enterica]|uniref:Tyrosine kinase n=1 Tax=Salmonella enterica I TaxID=59201 RepID=A0A379WRX9_SALET|nr:tyrosine kinase [Salmonella enterica subsp. enterica]